MRSETGLLLAVASLLFPPAEGPVDPIHTPAAGSTEEADELPGMPWQRSLEDALALVEATGKPLLVCVNVDGETASDSIARGRYRDPEFIALASGFVPVLASPIRHTPADHTQTGRRMVDPRFGRLVDGEHVTLEPIVYRRYFDGRRVAPRHVGVAPDGRILFDLFLLNDLSTIDRTLEQHGVFDVQLPDPRKLSEEELLASPDAGARDRLEELFFRGNRRKRARIAAEAFSPERATQHAEIVRLALRDEDPEVRLVGAREVAEDPLRGAEFLTRAFAIAAGDPDLRAALAEGAAELARAEDVETRRRGEKLAGVLAGLVASGEVLDLEAWGMACSSVPPGERPTPDADASSKALAALGRELDAAPDDAVLQARHAATLLELAQAILVEGGNPTFALTDCRDGARRAQALGLEGEMATRAAAVEAVACHLLSEPAPAAEAARRALPGLVAFAAEPLAHDAADALARAGIAAVYGEIGRQDPVDAAAVAEAVAVARAVLLHPYATEKDYNDTFEFFEEIEAFAEQRAHVRAGVLRFPESGDLHEWLRYGVLRDEGLEALQELYESLDPPREYRPAFVWHAALAQTAAAELLGRDGLYDEAMALFRRSISTFERSVRLEREFAPAAEHYMVFAHTGMARCYLDQGELDDAVRELRAAAGLVPSSFAERDGLGRLPKDFVGELQTALRREGRRDEALELGRDLKEAGVRL